MLQALIAGQAAPAAMAGLAKRRMRSKLPLLEQALTGRVRAHHRRLLAMQLAHIDFLDAQITALSDTIHTCLLTLSPLTEPPCASLETSAAQGGSATAQAPPVTFPRAVELLDTIPGVDQRGAEMLVAEDRGRHDAIWHSATLGGLGGRGAREQ
jgi:transposase